MPPRARDNRCVRAQESHTEEIKKLQATWKATEEQSVQQPGTVPGTMTPEPIRKALKMLNLADVFGADGGGEASDAKKAN